MSTYGPTHVLTKAFTAGAAIGANKIVKFSADGTVIESTAATDISIGVAPDYDVASGDTVPVQLGGIALCKAGGTVGIGALVVSGAAGVAVAAAAASGVNNRIIGRALQAAVSGDVFAVLVMPVEYQGQ